MIKVLNKETNKEKELGNRQAILINLLAPIKDEFSLVSNTLTETVEKYKDVPITKYEPTPRELKRMAEDKEFALDIPLYHIKGYDEEVSSSAFEGRINEEFFTRLMNKDRKLISFINEVHPKFKVV